MLLIYTHKITSRFSYTMKQIFNRMLGIETKFTTRVEDFIRHDGPKITYTRQPLQNEFFIRSNDLLFEHGINEIDIVVSDWEGLPCFFQVGERSEIPFDIFAASFYLMSRYEEYLPYLKDMHGRFPPAASLAFKHNFLQLPVVDLWAYKFLEKLRQKFPQIQYAKRLYQYTSIIDVTTSHCFAHRGLVRGMAGLFLDLGTFKWKRVADRLGVWFRMRKDPYDNYSELRHLHYENPCNAMFFFQFADYSTYDKNVSTDNNKFRYLIKSVADYSTVSLAASYSSFRDIGLLKTEKKRLSDVIHRPVDYVRMRYNRVDVPETYRKLVDAEFTADFTMGYTHEMGFRAGTCSPFFFYDVSMEVQQPIKVHPFAIHDYSLLKYKSADQAMEAVMAFRRRINHVGGLLVTVFSNELLGGEQDIEWMHLYQNVIKECHVPGTRH